MVRASPEADTSSTLTMAWHAATAQSLEVCFRETRKLALARIWRGQGRSRSDLRSQTSHRIPRLEVDLRGPRRRRPQRYSRHSGNDVTIKAYRGREASVPG